MRGIMTCMEYVDEPGMINHGDLGKTFTEAKAASVAVTTPAREVKEEFRKLPNRGDVVSCLIQGDNGMEEIPVTVIEGTAAKNSGINFALFLVRSKCRMSMIVHKEEWMAMADNTRNVANDDVDTAGSYLAGKESMYMELAHCTYGGKTGRSIEAAANKLWKNVSPTRIKASRLIV